MQDKDNEFTDDEMKFAKVEERFTASSLLQELESLICDYFISVIDKANEKLILNFFNGQKFEITANEVT